MVSRGVFLNTPEASPRVLNSFGLVLWLVSGLYSLGFGFWCLIFRHWLSRCPLWTGTVERLTGLGQKRFFLFVEN